MPAICDVAIVGGGPAGLAAATRLRQCGVGSVVVLERELQAGGIPRHCGHYPFGMREFHKLLRGPDYARRLVARAEAAGVAIHTSTSVVALKEGPGLTLSTPEGKAELAARRILLCTGVRETSRAQRMIGGQRPLGIVSTGALQSMVYLAGTKPFQRPVIVGSELVSLSAILTCRHAGIRPLAMVEEADRVTAWRASSALPRLLGIPLLLETELTAICGHERVEAVRLSDRDGGERTLETDGVIVTGRFQPEASLMRMGHLAVDPGSGGPVIDQYGRCSDPDFFAAGNLLRPVETAGWSWREGVCAAEAIAESLAGTLPETETRITIEIDHPAIKLAVPQTVSLPLDQSGLAGRSGMDHIQLRFARAAPGRLTVLDGETEVWSKAVSGLPERRVLIPLRAIAQKAGGRRLSIGVRKGG
ncbi:MAG TPA: FAD-dependent oxidoreductase [Afifellaceae bacterium]|nr:FAD-dependent oxidoreductase [Afifellaceae bacterium]